MYLQRGPSCAAHSPKESPGTPPPPLIAEPDWLDAALEFVSQDFLAAWLRLHDHDYASRLLSTGTTIMIVANAQI